MSATSSVAIGHGNDRAGACCCARAAKVDAVQRPPQAVARAMARVPGGDFLMGSDTFYREERPQRAARVDPFWIDPTPVTNAAFARFVDATGYRTVAERDPDPALYPDADPALIVPGSSVFTKPPHRVSLRDFRAWWAYVPGACWKHPEGPDSSIDGRGDHPVVHVAFEDAQAYADWAGLQLPTEAEWEFAARGGLANAVYPWGDEFMPDGRAMANTWQGQFPSENLATDGFEGTSPVKSYPANGYGLYDVVGNVWEWTVSPFARPALPALNETTPNEATGPAGEAPPSCCSTGDKDPALATRTVKGGSHLCAPNYCVRYRPAARQGQTLDTSTSHIGFRCVLRDTAGLRN